MAQSGASPSEDPSRLLPTGTTLVRPRNEQGQIFEAVTLRPWYLLTREEMERADVNARIVKVYEERQAGLKKRSRRIVVGGVVVGVTLGGLLGYVAGRNL